MVTNRRSIEKETSSCEPYTVFSRSLSLSLSLALSLSLSVSLSLDMQAMSSEFLSFYVAGPARASDHLQVT